MASLVRSRCYYIEIIRCICAVQSPSTRDDLYLQAIPFNANEVGTALDHPSGDPDPSPPDENITRKLREASSLVDVRLLDHLIVAETIYSFAEHGLL